MRTLVYYFLHILDILLESLFVYPQYALDVEFIV